uniref:Uncharacterized protein n=1 Tax=Xenopus tropicalis TaxID=8364 RepID=A0A803JVL3_XENTR
MGQTNQYIHKIKDSKGELQVLPEKIAHVFKSFYEDLYNIPQAYKQETLTSKIKEYLTKHPLPK